MLAIAITPIHLLLRYAYTFFLVRVAGLIGVDVIGHIGMGAKRWLRWAG